MEGVIKINSNEKFNINLTNAKGLERVIGIVASFIIKAQGGANTIIYGKGGKPDPKAPKFKKALNKGIIYILRELSQVDFCNILNYLTNSVKLGQVSFDPNKPPANGSSNFEIKKWKIQKKAYEYQVEIDRFYGLYGTATGKDSRLGLKNLVNTINLSIDTLTAEDALGDPNITKQFAEVSLITNYLKSIKSKFRNLNIEAISSKEVQDIITVVRKIRELLIAIQALNSPANLIASLDSLGGGRIQEEFRRINAVIDAPSKLIPALKDLIRLINNIISVATTVLRYIGLIKTIITLALLLIRIFNIIKAFFLSNPIPSLYTTLGIQVAVGKTFQQALEEQGSRKLVARLSQINEVLALMVTFVSSLVAAMNQILIILKSILMNLESCKNAEDGIKKELEETINNLQNAITPLQEFLNQANETEERKNKTFGEYTIEIVKEEVVDEGIQLRRRYGIARNKNNAIAVESTPTFASLDLIIINEVKVLLVSKGLVKIGAESMNSEEIAIILESMKYVGDSDITMDNLELIPDIGEEGGDTATGEINSFVSNLSGGRAFKKKMMKRLSDRKKTLGSELKSSDPNGSYTSGVIKQNENQKNQT